MAVFYVFVIENIPLYIYFTFSLSLFVDIVRNKFLETGFIVSLEKDKFNFVIRSGL